MQAVGVNLAREAVKQAPSYIVPSVFSWAGYAVRTWGPGFVASLAVNGSAALGSQLGGSGVIGSVCGLGGRVFGWSIAPSVGSAVQGKINFYSPLCKA